MATARKVQLVVGEWPEFYRPGIPSESAQSASRLLQENHEKHHIFFNDSGFHNHIAHQIPTIWALGASPNDLQRAYDHNISYQRDLNPPLDSSVAASMHDPEKFKSFLGDGKYYPDYLKFFATEIDQSGWQAVLQKYLFARDDRAEDMLLRLFAGILHPLIHLGFGIEFHQPTIIVEALAQTAVHTDRLKPFFMPAEKVAASRSGEPSKSIVQLLDEIQNDQQLRKGFKSGAEEQFIDCVAQFRVKPDELAIKTAEMTNAVAYHTAGAQRTDRAIKYDFVLMHSVNCSMFYSAFMKQDWLSDANKARLLEWKVRHDLSMYAAQATPKIHLDEIRNYKPRHPSGWDGIFDRVLAMDEDGHVAKLVRALAHGQRICQPYEDREEFRIKHDDWLQMGHMAVDSRATGAPDWVRAAGTDQAWEQVAARAQL